MTEERPLLSFGQPVTGLIPPAAPGFSPPPRGPAPERQGQRLAPLFAALSEALAARRLTTTANADEPDPELVVVFDLAGTVQQFRRAVRDVAGLEFLAELTEEDTEPDADFAVFDKDVATTRAVPETLYTMMSNARAVTQLIRLFQRWQANPTAAFPSGMAPLKEAFAQMRAVRRWGPTDRVRDTGLLDAWRESVEVIGGQGATRVEIELWFRATVGRRAAAQAQVEQMITGAGGVVVHSAEVKAVSYHALLVDLPPGQVQAVLDAGPDAIELLTTETVMFVSPAEPMGVRGPEPSARPLPAIPPPPEETRPRVALLDGAPLANHTALTGRLLIDDPDERANAYTSAQRQHGTAMASVICHGDLSAPGHALSSRLYLRPVMQPGEYFAGTETVVRDELLVDLVHRSFHRMFEGDGADPPAAPGVRVVNLSLGDPARVFVRRLSPLAALLDWLAHRYNLLILVSAGNHPDPPDVDGEALAEPSVTRAAMLGVLHEQARNRRLLAPAEAVNVVTVGAVHEDASAAPESDTVLDVTGAGMPAPYSASGFGHRRSVKPEILLPGGRQLFQQPPPAEGSVRLVAARQNAVGPGVQVAAPSDFGADATAYGVGTSYAAALATRTSNQILDVLEDLPAEQVGLPFPGPQYHPVLAKALLIHAAGWGGMDGPFRELLDLKRRDLTQVLGYGRVDPDRVATAARTRVCLLGAGSIGDGQRQRFACPLPDALRASTQWRRLVVTLAWLSPVNPRSRLHRTAKLTVKPPDVDFGVKRREADSRAVNNGTVQHEMLEGRKARAFVSGESVALNVDCRITSGSPDTAIRYGLAVSIEMATTVNADVHAQVREGLRAQVRSQPRIRPRG